VRRGGCITRPLVDEQSNDQYDHWRSTSTVSHRP
jgi:hypothetical protein